MAISQAFFSIGIAMATPMVYGAYLDKRVSISNSSAVIVLVDAGVALLAGLAIFPLVFANDLEPSSGSGLIFQTLPLAFGKMAGGHLIGAVFFLLLVAAGIATCIGCLEPVVVWICNKLDWNRARAAVFAGLIAWLFGLGAVFSYNLLSDFYPLEFISAIKIMTIYEIEEFMPANVLLLLGGILMSLFAAWVIAEKVIRKELGEQSQCY